MGAAGAQGPAGDAGAPGPAAAFKWAPFNHATFGAGAVSNLASLPITAPSAGEVLVQSGGWCHLIPLLIQTPSEIDLALETDATTSPDAGPPNGLSGATVFSYTPQTTDQLSFPYFVQTSVSVDAGTSTLYLNGALTNAAFSATGSSCNGSISAFFSTGTLP